VRRVAPLILTLLAIGGCHRKPDAVPADAAAEAQSRTSAKALADVAAAEEAARTPLPPSERRDEPAPTKRAASDTEPADDVGTPELTLNEAAPH
jgi:hypothetical protein